MRLTEEYPQGELTPYSSFTFRLEVLTSFSLAFSSRPDEHLQGLVEGWREPFQEFSKKVIGQTINDLDQSTCQDVECSSLWPIFASLSPARTDSPFRRSSLDRHSRKRRLRRHALGSSSRRRTCRRCYPQLWRNPIFHPSSQRYSRCLGYGLPFFERCRRRQDDRKGALGSV